jgi:1-deoxy-D-xylulose-5-phosphate synthase
MAPKDENELRHMLLTMVEYDGGPVAVRYPRDYGYGVDLDKKLKSLEIGKGEVLEQGEDVALVGIGSMAMPCVQASEMLSAQGIRGWVINARFVKPLDEELLTRVASSVKLVVTVEENSVCGGFGSAVSELLMRLDIDTPVTVLGLPDRFVNHGPRHDLLDNLGLSAQSIAGAVKAALARSA